MLALDDAPATARLVIPSPSAPDGLPAVALEAGPDDAAIVENLVNQIAHDVRNFAFTMGLQAEMGLRRAAAAPEVSGNMEAVLRQIEKLKTYLDTLLLYGRPVTLDPTEFDPRAVARDEARRLQFEAQPSAAPVTIAVEAADDVAPVRWDRRVFGAVLHILLDNALRSADPPPPITVAMSAGDGAVTVRVVDRGRGIAEEDLPRIFDPMAVRRAGGTGLGLAITRKMAEAHGGTVSVESGPSGTTVELQLPREVHAG